MENKGNFLLTWPSILVFIPFTLFSVVFMLWVLVAAHPAALHMMVPGLKRWAVTILVIWLGIAVGLVGIYRCLDRRKEDDLDV
ncbi:hypothetical protein [Syntrophomonas erecta]